MEFATLSQMFIWDMIVLLFSAFSSLYLVFGMLVIARKRYLFLLSGVSVLWGTVFYPFSIQSAVFHLFDSMAYWGARVSFLGQIRSALLLWSLFLFRFPQLSLLP
jgi:hypothetical protein